MKAKNDGKKKLLKASEFQYGGVEMTDVEYRDAQDPKIRTTIFLEASLIRACKAEAAKRGIKYQQYVREVLRKALTEPSDLSKRVERLEELVFRKRA